MRVVLDANVIVSAANTFEIPSSRLAMILRAGIRRRYSLIISEHILGEVSFALSKPFFNSRLASETVNKILDGLAREAEKVELVRAVHGIASHWQDDLVLSTALSGDADFLVTGDRELLDLVHSYPFRIIHPHDFIPILEGDDAAKS